MSFGKKQKLLFLFFLLLFLFSGANFLFALEVIYPPLPVPGAPAPPTSQSTLPDYVDYIFYAALFVGTTIAFGILIYSGVLYILSFNKPDRMASAREWARAAIFGLLFLFISFIIAKTINPDFTILEFPTIEELKTIDKEQIPALELANTSSSIHVMLPFGQIIMKIFETYNFDPSQKETKIPRIQRIQANTNQTFNIVEDINKQNNQLVNLVLFDINKCACQYTTAIGSQCSSDPCIMIRQKIEEIEKSNLKKLELLKQEREKTIAENKDLKKELDRLERVENFIRYCSSSLKDSYAQFLERKKYYENQGTTVREFDFWDDISLAYINKAGKEISDWATFTCLIGGTILPQTKPILEEQGPEQEIENWEGAKVCSAEAPVGDIIDRAKRTAGLLIEKLEKIIALDKELADAVDQLQILISQCSSQKCVVQQGICIGEPCPIQEIKNQIAKIEEIWNQIDKLVKNPKPEEKEKYEEIGVNALINPNDPESVVYNLLKDLDNIESIGPQDEQGKFTGSRGIRYTLESCGISEYKQTLSICRDSVGKLGPEGKGIGTCCLDEIVFQRCLDECYLEQGEEKYKECLQECLDRESKEAAARGAVRPEEISRCRHLLNFYCCEK